MQAKSCNWLLNESWGWGRFLTDGLIGIIWWPFRLITAICCVAAGVAVADMLSSAFGIPGWAAVPLSITGVLLLVWAVVLGRILLFFPFPPCKRGTCQGIGAYTWAKGRIYGRERWRTYRYWCGCGDEYVRRGDEFRQVLSDGEERPYLRLDQFGKWRSEETNTEESCRRQSP